MCDSNLSAIVGATSDDKKYVNEANIEDNDGKTNSKPIAIAINKKSKGGDSTATTTPTHSGAEIAVEPEGKEQGNKKQPLKLGHIKKKKGKIQTKLPQHLNTNYARMFQLRFDLRLMLDSIMDEADTKNAIVTKFKALVSKIMEEANTAVLYP